MGVGELFYAYFEDNVVYFLTYDGEIYNTFTFNNEIIIHTYNLIIVTDQNYYRLAFEESEFADTNGQYVLVPIESLHEFANDIQFYQDSHLNQFLIFKSKPEKIYSIPLRVK